MAAIVQLDAVIPVLAFSGNDFGAWSIQQSLNAKGYSSNVQPLQGQKKLQVRLKKIEGRAPNGAPIFGTFDDAVGKADIKAVAGSWFTTLAAFKEWTVTTTAKVVETAVDALPGQGTYSKAYEKAQLAIKNDGLLASLGIPWWVPWLVGGAAGLYVLNSVVSAKKTFLGNAPRMRGVALGAGTPKRYNVWVESAELWTALHTGYGAVTKSQADAIVADIRKGISERFPGVAKTAKLRILPEGKRLDMYTGEER